ncbi:MAG TPA: hypothetical protein GXZ45_09620 [Propionibacterium sp.]|nr:hypothetical protein [Propionibacterium sp.]
MGFRTALSRTLVLTVLAVLVGGVAALLWATMSVLPSWTVMADGHAEIADAARTQVFSANFWYAILGVAGGLAIGIAAWVRLRSVGWPVAVITAALAVIGALTCWWLGEIFGPGPFAERLAAAEPGQQVPIALLLTAPSALAVWVFAAVAVPLFAASLGPEVARPEPEAVDARVASDA